jgi:hypothetical protein
MGFFRVFTENHGVGRATRQTDDGPVLLPEQPLDDVASDHSERSDDYGLFVLTQVCPILATAMVAVSKALAACATRTSWHGRGCSA